MPGEERDKAGRTRLMDGYGLAMSLLWLALWLLPMAYVGSAGRSVSFFPRYMRDLQSVACLFPNEVKAWTTYHAEAQFRGSASWREIDLEDYFQVQIFGYHTHVARILANSYARHGGDRRVREVAEYLRDEYAQRFPAEAQPIAIRFVRARHPVEALAEQVGCFRRRPLGGIPWARLRRFGEVRFDGRPAAIDHEGRRIPKASP